MSIFDSLLGILAAHDCLGCGRESALVCNACISKIPPAYARCYRCQKSSPGGYTCNVCSLQSPLRRVQAAAAYRGLAKDLIWKLKSAGAQVAAREAARLSKEPISIAHDHSPVTRCYMVPVPTASSRARQRGYDQATLLARHFSRQYKMIYKNCLVRRGHAHQVGASRQQRFQQIAGAFRVKSSAKIAGAHIIIIDDVMTTGASLDTAARTLHQAGAHYIEAVVFAQA